jgi:hypothetical protein
MDVVNELVRTVQHLKKDVVIKLSFLNPTIQSKKIELVSPAISKLYDIKAKFDAEGFDSYIFGTEEDCRLGCGQIIGNYLNSIEY